MIEMGGLVDWAAMVPGPWSKSTSGSLNTVTGIVVHSAEGYAAGMQTVLADLRPPLSKRASWHLSVYKDGSVEQHYTLRAIAWHATAMNPFTVGVECEGKGEPLTDAQVDSVVRIIKDVAEWQQWPAIMRPTSKDDRDAELWEHNEGIRFGGSPTACPSGRIDWGKILAGVNGDDMDEETKRLLADREGRVDLGDLLGSNGEYNTRISADRLWLEFYDPRTGLLEAKLDRKGRP